MTPHRATRGDDLQVAAPSAKPSRSNTTKRRDHYDISRRSYCTIRQLVLHARTHCRASCAWRISTTHGTQIDPVTEAPDTQWYVRYSNGNQYGPAPAQMFKNWMGERTRPARCLDLAKVGPSGKSPAKFFYNWPLETPQHASSAPAKSVPQINPLDFTTGDNSENLVVRHRVKDGVNRS